MHKEIFKKITERQIKGTMFHSNLADYYSFLHLDIFKDYQSKQFLKECKNLRRIKEYFIYRYNSILLTNDEDLSVDNITPKEWEAKTSLDVDEASLKILLKQSLEQYLKWEKETKEMYEEYAHQLLEDKKHKDYYFISKIIADVTEEVESIENIMIYLQGLGYDISKADKLQYMLKLVD